ncbi:MAG: AAA family ATPase [Clostridia bacterium]|nr:AAA family ATPase [Clostridia bacterium]
MKYGLIGEKLGHSFSPDIHKRLATSDYVLKEIPRDTLGEFLAKKEFVGVNVTIPYKQDVIPYLHYISDSAQYIGAVNVIVNKDGVLHGYNTDFYGLKALVLKTAGDISGKKVLILGTGGTSRTALAVAKALGASRIDRVGRTEKEGCVTYAFAYEHLSDSEIIINTTPVGMFPECDAAPIDINAFPNLQGVVDVVFNPISTNLVLSAQAKGIPAMGGLYMLVYQAVAASELFANVKYEESIIENIYKELKSSKQNIVLTGMPGCGKSTVGRLLAEKTGREFYDIDTEIVKQAGMEITEIFETRGEKAFRDMETETAKRLSTLSGVVISCGGGTVLRDENVNALRRNGVICFIDRPLNELIPTEDRPLALSKADIEKRYNERIDRYISTCHIRIPVEGDANSVAQKIGKEFLN